MHRAAAFTLVLLWGCCWAGAVRAERVAQAPLELEVKAPPLVSLSLTPNVINFPDADPDAAPTISAQENPVRVNISVRGKQLTLMVLASTHLLSGADTIDISNVTWKATGAGFVDGRFKIQEDIPVGKWLLSIGFQRIAGTLSFYLANSWQYAVGTYRATVIFTATAF